MICGPLLDERAENTGFIDLRKSLFFPTKAIVLLCPLPAGYYPRYCDYYLSCQFQDDGTTNFEKIPDVEGIEFHGCAISPAEVVLPHFFRPPSGVRPLPCQRHRSRGGASSVVIQNGQPKVKLRISGRRNDMKKFVLLLIALL